MTSDLARDSSIASRSRNSRGGLLSDSRPDSGCTSAFSAENIGSGGKSLTSEIESGAVVSGAGPLNSGDNGWLGSVRCPVTTGARYMPFPRVVKGGCAGTSAAHVSTMQPITPRKPTARNRFVAIVCSENGAACLRNDIATRSLRGRSARYGNGDDRVDANTTTPARFSRPFAPSAQSANDGSACPNDKTAIGFRRRGGW